MAKYVCTVCGYIAEGSIPEKCPVCGAASKAFKELTDLTLAAEHEFGVYGKTVKNNPDISE